MLAMAACRAIDEIVERQFEQPFDLAPATTAAAR